MRISEKSFRVHWGIGKPRIGILPVSLAQALIRPTVAGADRAVGSEGFYDFCDALTAGGADSKIGLIKM